MNWFDALQVLRTLANVATLVLALSGCTTETVPSSVESASQLKSPTEMGKAVDNDINNKEPKMTEAPPRELIVSRTNEANQVVRLGVLKFAGSNGATLMTEGSSLAVDQLQRDWQEVSKLPELLFKKSVPTKEDGKLVYVVTAKTVRPGDPEYIYAVLNKLEHSYGYRIDFGDK